MWKIGRSNTKGFYSLNSAVAATSSPPVPVACGHYRISSQRLRKISYHGTAPDWISCEPLWHTRDPRRERRGLGRHGRSTFHLAFGQRRRNGEQRSCVARHRPRSTFQASRLCRWRNKHLPDPLGAQGQQMDAHVAIFLGDDHFLSFAISQVLPLRAQKSRKSRLVAARLGTSSLKSRP